LEEVLRVPSASRSAFMRYVEHWDDRALDSLNVPRDLPGMSLADLKLSGQMFRLTYMADSDHSFTRTDAAKFILDNIYSGDGTCEPTRDTCRVGPGG
jgi:hypothetical protein